jgi:hypothetical protein
MEMMPRVGGEPELGVSSAKGICDGRRGVGGYSPPAALKGSSRRREPATRATLEAAILRRNSFYVWDSRHLGYVWTFSLVGLDLQANALMRTTGMVARSSHLHIQDHRNKNNKRITSRTIGTPASLLTMTGDTEKVVTNIHKNAQWQHMRTTRTRPSNLLGKV